MRVLSCLLLMKDVVIVPEVQYIYPHSYLTFNYLLIKSCFDIETIVHPLKFAFLLETSLMNIYLFMKREQEQIQCK